MKKSILSHPLLEKRRADVSKTNQWFDDQKLKANEFCIMPFVNIILEPGGDVGFCRHKGTEFIFGNIQNSTLSEIWNGEKIKSWRREFISGEIKTCSKELHDQQCNLCPQLNTMQAKVTLNEEQSFPPLRLTANLNGKCNLECQMCHVWQLPNGFYTEENFWKPGREEMFPHLEEIDMLSGEPLIQADTFKLIEEVSSLNPDCLWSITTNAHWNLGKKITDALDKIKIKNLIISVDSFEVESYAKIRKKGNLSIVLKTIEDLIVYEKDRVSRGLSPLSMNLNFLIQKDNWKEVKSAIDYCLERNIHPFLTFCHEPLEYSLLSLELSERIDILNYYLDNLTWDYLTQIRRITVPLLESLPIKDKKLFLIKMMSIKESFES